MLTCCHAFLIVSPSPTFGHLYALKVRNSFPFYLHPGIIPAVTELQGARSPSLDLPKLQVALHFKAGVENVFHTFPVGQPSKGHMTIVGRVRVKSGQGNGLMLYVCTVGKFIHLPHSILHPDQSSRRHPSQSKVL